MKYQRLFTEQSFDKKKLKQEYLEFKKFVISNRLTESTTKLNEGLIPSGLKDKFAFIKNIAKEIGVQVSDLIKLFLNKGIFILFAKMKWSIVELWKIVKAGFDLYKSLFEAWAKFIRENKITKGIIDKTAEKIKLVNDFFEEHPNLKKVGGVVVAGLLVYIWLNATMVGHKDIDFDISTIINALLGKFDLADLFLSENGLIMLTNFIVGKVTGLTFPYPGSDLAKFTFAVIFTLAKKVKVKLEKEDLQESEKDKESFYKENNIDPDDLDYLGKGEFGEAYSIDENRVLKITKSKSEFDIAKKLEDNNSKVITNAFAKIYKAEIVNGDKLIILEKLEEDSDIENLYNELLDYLNEQGLSIEYLGHLNTDEIELSSELTKFINDLEDIIRAYNYLGIERPDIKYDNLGYSKDGKLKAFDIDNKRI